MTIMTTFRDLLDEEQREIVINALQKFINQKKGHLKRLTNDWEGGACRGTIVDTMERVEDEIEQTEEVLQIIALECN